MPDMKREKTPQQALASLMRLCSRSEKCISDARRLLRGWGVSDDDAERIVQRLVTERFIDEYRYASALVSDKVSMSGWGVHKIRAALAAKGIERGAAERALSGIDREKDAERLLLRMERKFRSLGPAPAYEKKTKTIRYGLSLGYDYGDVVEAADKICRYEQNDED